MKHFIRSKFLVSLLFAPLFLIATMWFLGKSSVAFALTPAPGFETMLFSTPANQLPFHINTIGPFTTDGNLLAITREQIGSLAEHNVLSINPAGVDVVLSSPAQYPTSGDNYFPGRYGSDILLDPTDPQNFALIADTGTICLGDPCTGDFPGYQNGRIFRMNLNSGDISVLIDSGVLVDPLSLAVNPANGIVYIADWGKYDMANDGRIAKIQDGTVVTVIDNIDPYDILFLGDGSFIFSTTITTYPFVGSDFGIFRVEGNTITKIFDLTGLLAKAPGGIFGTNIILSTQDKVLELIDNNGDFVVDSTRTIVESAATNSPNFIPLGMAFDPNGILYVLEGILGQPFSIYKITPDKIQVEIDIKPGADPNTINAGAEGVIPVAILTTDTFDASTVDPFTVTLEGGVVRLKGKSGNAGAMEDVDGDGDLDLVVHIMDWTLSPGQTTAVLSAKTNDGKSIQGTATIVVQS